MTRQRIGSTLILVVAFTAAIQAAPDTQVAAAIGRLCSYLADAATSLLAIGPTIDYGG